MDEQTIGANAGKIWHILDVKGKATRYQLLTESQLTAPEVDASIGWLSRENKIHRDGEFFSLGKTNLHKTIGMNAQVVFQVLKKIPYSLSMLHKLTELNAIEIHQAIGWLTREGNINLGSEPIISDILDEQEKTMQFLRDETEILQHDLDDRNMIITQLSRQINESQNQSMHQAYQVDNLQNQMKKNEEIISIKNIDINEKNTQLTLLHQEIQSLHNDINSRNQIITDLSKQLTNSQFEAMKQTHAIEQLQQQLIKTSHTLKPVHQSSLQARLAHVSSIEQMTSEQETMPSVDIESRLYNTKSPVLDLQESQDIHASVVQPKSIDEIHKTVDQVIHDRMHKMKLH